MADDGERKPIPLRGLQDLGTPRKGKRATTLPPYARSSSPAIIPPAELADPQLDPEFKLRAVLDMSRRAWEEYEEVVNEADDFGIGSLGPGQEDLQEARERLRGQVRQRYNRWMELQTQLAKAETDVRRRKLERPLIGQDHEEFASIRDKLKEEYEGLGAHYELLCENCASLTVRLRRMETSGRDYESQEYTELHNLYLKYINQLQKYTEAMKTESINKQTQDVALSIIQVFERHFGTAHPAEWNAAVNELKSVIESAA